MTGWNKDIADSVRNDAKPKLSIRDSAVRDRLIKSSIAERIKKEMLPDNLSVKKIEQDMEKLGSVQATRNLKAANKVYKDTLESLTPKDRIATAAEKKKIEEQASADRKAYIEQNSKPNIKINRKKLVDVDVNLNPNGSLGSGAIKYIVNLEMRDYFATQLLGNMVHGSRGKLAATVALAYKAADYMMIYRDEDEPIV